jgi:hypothetical protein
LPRKQNWNDPSPGRQASAISSASENYNEANLFLLSEDFFVQTVKVARHEVEKANRTWE